MQTAKNLVITRKTSRAECGAACRGDRLSTGLIGKLGGTFNARRSEQIGHGLKQSDVVISNTAHQCQKVKEILNQVQNDYYKKLAFTLAEVLITLGIIGIVAAMTIPTLMSNFAKQKLEEQIKVTYSSIQQTMKYMDYEGLGYDVFQDYSDEAMKDWYDNFIAKHMKTETVCINKAGCWHKYGEAKDLNGDKNPYDRNNNIGWGANILTFTTAKGAWFDMDGNSPRACNNWFGIDTKGNTCLVIYFDANGDRKPNQIGKDIQAVVWTEQGLVPAGASKTKERINNNCLKGNGYWCLSKIIDNSWKIPDELWKRK